jgi:hypothetical protein
MTAFAKSRRREPLKTRKATLASLLRRSLPGLRLNEHLVHDGESVFRHACKMGLEGIVSKRLDSHLPIRSIQGLAQVQEPGGTGGQARGRRGMGKMTKLKRTLDERTCGLRILSSTMTRQ